MTATLVQPDRRVGLHDIGRRLDRVPVGRVHRKVVVAIGLGLFFEVYEIFLSSTIATALKTQYGFGGTALQLLMASSFIGMFVGAAAFGRIADRIGRKKAFLVNLVWFSVWSIIGAFAPNPWMLVGARFMAGIGVGAEYPVADSYLSDVLPKADRGRLAAWTYTCSFVAVPVLGFLSLSLNGHSIFGFAGWRFLLVVGAIGALFVIALRRGLPESPRWLAGVGRMGEAEAAVRAFETGSAPAAENSVDDDDYEAEDVEEEPVARSTAIARLRLSPYRQRMTMLAFFHLFQPFGYYGFGTLAALVLVSRGYDVTSSLLFTAVSFIGYPLGSLASIPLLKRFERKYLIMATVAVMAICGVLFATVSAPAMIVVFGLLTTAASNVFSNIYHVYQAEIFPNDVRATAVGWTYSLSRLSSAALPFILIPVLNHYGAAAMFTVVLVALAAAVAVLIPFGPRTTGRSLDEINPT
ncbi:MFS transporter [Mycolicibacterium sp. 120270]|uniref:MFS transporter n=1 Tax=Mycolicibacterium sp. 120270 TaxID=3090600 RepID=UPI00299E79C5|nr:MFS transporter [Mycolicibacterium sp. 120270]MDX1884758.1 MFS transporter [Mycolicibacterium sp. 120270]